MFTARHDKTEGADRSESERDRTGAGARLRRHWPCVVMRMPLGLDQAGLHSRGRAAAEPEAASTRHARRSCPMRAKMADYSDVRPGQGGNRHGL